MSSTESVFASHFPRFPVLPGVLILDGLARLGGTLLKASAPGSWDLVSAEQVKFRHFVRPGDRLDLGVTVEAQDDHAAVLRGQAEVEGRVVATARSLRYARAGAR